MTLTVFRHAEKQVSWSENPGLSAYGESQADSLAKMISEFSFPPPTQLLCSPKIRTVGTFTPLAKTINIDIEIFPELDERSRTESTESFRRKIGRFIESVSLLSGSILICTHLDWIEDFLISIPLSDELPPFTWGPAAFMSFEHKSNSPWKLICKGMIE